MRPDIERVASAGLRPIRADEDLGWLEVMRKLRLSISDPDVLVVERPGTTWILLGLELSDAARLEASDGKSNGPDQDLCLAKGDASLLKIRYEGGVAVSLEAWKPVTSCHEIFYCCRPDGEVIVSDHFRSVLSRLPLADRSVPASSIVDLFLFNSVQAGGTYCSEIGRLGHGRSLFVDLCSGATSTTVFDRIETGASERSENGYVERIDSALSHSLAPFKQASSTANLFSGGVDSVLVQTYLGKAVPAVYMVLDSLEADSRYELRYAEHAADLLGIGLESHRVRESDYLEQLESTIGSLGMPPLYPTMVFFDQAFQQDYRTFITGDLAGSLFGESGRLARAASYLASPPGIVLARLITKLLPPSAKPGWKSLLPNAVGLNEHPHALYGYGASSGTDTVFSSMFELFGEELVRERLQSRLDYLLGLLVPAAPDSNRFLRHLEIGQWFGYLCSDHLSFSRQLAQAYSKAVVSPFASRHLFSSALEIPIEQRYMSGFQGKYLLKRLLASRLPGYPVNQRKAYSRVSFKRYCESGPLKGIWERYAVPDFIGPDHRGLILDEPNPMTWHAIVFALWRDLIWKNPEISSGPARYRLDWQ